VAVLIVDVEMPWVQSLKEKRGVITPLIERLRHRFALSVARLDGLDAHRWERLGVVAIGADRTVLERLMGRARDTVAAADLRIVRERLDIEPWDDPEEV
jgi:uncharacterized protein YlxP (DUF503 family)